MLKFWIKKKKINLEFKISMKICAQMKNYIYKIKWLERIMKPVLILFVKHRIVQVPHASYSLNLKLHANFSYFLNWKFISWFEDMEGIKRQMIAQLYAI